MAYQAQINIKTTGLAGLNKINASVDRINKAIISINKGGSRIKAGKDLVKSSQADLKVKQKILKVETDIANQIQRQNTLRGKRGAGGSSSMGGSRAGGGGGFGAAVSSAAVSGAFPLLFGQGPAAAAGGFGGGLIGSALGGLTGAGQMGGFAGGLIGTTVVTAFQEQVLGLANALDPLNADIDLAIQKIGGLSSARKDEIKIIEQFRGKQAALREITKELTDVIGEDGVEAFRKLRESAKLFTDKFADFALKLSAKAAGIVNDTKEFLNPGGFGVAQAQAGLESIDDQSIKDLTKKLEDLRKKLDELPDVNFQEAFSFGLIGGDSARKKISDKAAVREQIEGVKSDIKSTAAKKAGLIIDNKASAALKNKVLATKLQLEDQERLNKLRRDGVVVMSKGLGEELLALEKLNDERKETFNTEKAIAQGIITELGGREELSKLDAEKLANARLTVESIEAQVLANDKNFENLKKSTIQARKLQNAANETVDAFEQLNITIQNDIKEGIKGLIKGTSTLGDMLNKVADRFLDLALNQGLFGNAGGKTITGGLFKMLGFANGGRPPVGKPSIVGEKGPELFIPRSSGTIVPNDKLGGGGNNNVTVNVDASGSDVQGDDAGGQELGTLIAVAVQGELVKQQRPGGLLNR